jgi:branched-chain amino acid transport system permease protein
LLVEQIVNGIVLGSLYALIAQGYTLVFGVLDKLNFAHGEVFMLGGYVAVASTALGLPLALALVLAIVVCAVVGIAVELVSFRKFRSHDAHITSALSSFAVGLVMVDLVQKSWGTEPLAIALPEGLNLASLEVLGVRFSAVKLAILAVATSLMLVLHLTISRTALGRAVRAVSESPAAASLYGIDVVRTIQVVFALASAMAGLAGAALALRTGFASPDMGFTLGLKALAIMAIGGMGDLRGAFLGGLLIGVFEALAFHWGLGQIADTGVWLIMIAVLLFRPSGLFAARASREVRA